MWKVVTLDLNLSIQTWHKVPCSLVYAQLKICCQKLVENNAKDNWDPACLFDLDTACSDAWLTPRKKLSLHPQNLLWVAALVPRHWATAQRVRELDKNKNKLCSKTCGRVLQYWTQQGGLSSRWFVSHYDFRMLWPPPLPYRVVPKI